MLFIKTRTTTVHLSLNRKRSNWLHKVEIWLFRYFSAPKRLSCAVIVKKLVLGCIGTVGFPVV